MTNKDENYVPSGFDQKSGVESYKFLTDISKIGLEYSKEIIKRLPRENCKILDVATGDGEFISYVLDRLNEKGCKVNLEANDLSWKMLRKAKKKFNQKDINSRIYLCDLNDLKKYPLDTNYDYINHTFALHYAKKPKKVIGHLIKNLSKEGLLIFAGCRGLFNYMVDSPSKEDNSFVPEELRDLWRSYFRLKHEKYPRWDPDPIADPTNTTLLIKYLQNNLRLHVLKKEYPWRRFVTLNQNLEWIISSPISSISAGVKMRDRKRFYDHVLNKLVQNGADLDKKIESKLQYDLLFVRRSKND